MSAEAAVRVDQATRRRIEGTVVSSKMEKTAVVQVEQLTKHPKYGKFFKKYAKYKVHDEKNELGRGDRVEIVESRPISKDKRFRLVKVIEKAKAESLIEIEA